MSTKERIIHNLNDIKSQDVLTEILDYIQKIRVSFSSGVHEDNTEFMSFAGMLSEEEADKMQVLINQEFSNIEGNWE